MSFFLNITYFSLNDSLFSEVNSKDHQSWELFLPKNAQTPLSYGSITRSNSTIYRLFESVNFTIDTFDFTYADNAKMQIMFSNGSIRHYEMIDIGNNEFSYKYTPEYDAPLGFQNVSFLIYNETNQLLNTQTTSTNFTILTNYMVSLDKAEYYIEDNLNAEIIVSNFKNYDFKWNLTIVDSLNKTIQNEIINLERNLVQFNLPLINDTFNKNQYYYIQLNMTDKNSGTRGSAYYPFYVKNNNPIITSILEISSIEVFRTDEFTISLNATDIETYPENLIADLFIYDSEGEIVIEDTIRFRSENLFSDNYIIPSEAPIGIYQVNATIIDEHGGKISKITSLTVKNNPPKINSYTINGMSMDQKISVYYGRDLVFMFNVSDVEGIAYITVALINENNEWFNITRAYYGENTQIKIRTIDLISGTWFVYIYVIDTDGVVIGLIDDYDKAPQGIAIIPDFITIYLPWVVFFAGLGIGILVGVGIIYGYFKSKILVTPKTAQIEPKKPSKKKKSKKLEKESQKKELEEQIPSKEEEKEEISKRKIKRKL
jgi:hypothetical protein